MITALWFGFKIYLQINAKDTLSYQWNDKLFYSKKNKIYFRKILKRKSITSRRFNLKTKIVLPNGKPWHYSNKFFEE
jgi:hypothetical protein